MLIENRDNCWVPISFTQTPQIGKRVGPDVCRKYLKAKIIEVIIGEAKKIHLGFNNKTKFRVVNINKVFQCQSSKGIGQTP